MTKSTDNFKSVLLRHKLLMLAVIVSILLHALLIIEFAFNLPLWYADNEDQTVLVARLVKQKPSPPPLPAPAKPPLAKPPAAKQSVEKPRPDETVTAPAPTPTAESTLATDTPEEDWSGTLSSATLNMNPTPTDMSAGNHDVGTQAENAADAGNSSTEEPQKIIYSRVETEFEVRRDVKSAAAGITKITFEINDGIYSIHSQTEAKGVASLFFGNLVQKSEGIVSSQGLKPRFYSYQYGSNAKKLQTATFNWDQGELRLHHSKGEHTVPLPQGTQDFLSFMYQFMFSPPLDHMQITMTNGKKLGTYDYSFEGEEIIHTKLGGLNTIHLLRSGSDEEKTEIWLATEYQYLPVRILKTEKNGTVIEQLAIKLITN